MIVKDQVTAEILIHSLEYIKKFHKKIVVIKYGGHAMVNENLKKSVIRDIVLLKYIGMNPIIVHGGGPDITYYMRLQGLEPTFIDGLRVTTPEVMKVVEMVLTGLISPNIVSLFNANEVPSISLNGKDGRTIQARQRDPKLGLVGEITGINTKYIHTILEQGYVPIVSPVAIGPNGESYNINSDEAAKRLAIALGAEKLILITDVDGVLRDYKDETTHIRRMTISEVKKAIDEGIITGGMIPKLDCCVGAIKGGVRRCHIINGKVLHSIIFELFTKTGIGTMITDNVVRNK
ncbi:MAG: acetylglutamate kinase [Tissierellia bacterium]|nr:acetylglutamate kinase [Tissierellia bacterium]